MTKQTTIAIRDYTVTQADNARTAALNTVSALVLWTAHNPGEGADVLAGKTPKAFKAFKVQLEAKGIDENRLRRVVTTGKKAAAMLAGVAGSEKEMDRKEFADHCARLVAAFDGLTVKQAIEGEQGLAAMIAAKAADSVDGIRKAYSDATAPDAPDAGETAVGEAQAAETEAADAATMTANDRGKRMATDAAAILAEGKADKVRAGDIAQVAQLVVAKGHDKAIDYVVTETAKDRPASVAQAAIAACDDSETLQAMADLIAARMQELADDAAKAQAAAA